MSDTPLKLLPLRFSERQILGLRGDAVPDRFDNPKPILNAERLNLGDRCGNVHSHPQRST
jgi:hypothetical protein